MSDPTGAREAPRPKRRRFADAIAENAAATLARHTAGSLELSSGAPSTREKRQRVSELWSSFAGGIGLGYVAVQIGPFSASYPLIDIF